MSSDNDATNESSSESSGFDRKLVCVNYPGIVKNVENMLSTLGGLQKLENAVGNRNKQLELRFRPKDVFCKPAIAEKNATSSLLVKIKVKSFDNDVTSLDESCYEYEILGAPTLTFNFNKCADFQYLPLACKGDENSDSILEYVLNELYPSELPKYKGALIQGTQSSTLFLPPRYYVKNDYYGNKLHFERASFYTGPYRPQVAQSIREQAEKRKRQAKSNTKSYGSIFFTFKDKNVPIAPVDFVLNAIKDKTIPHQKYAEIKEHFKRRPIWSKIALQHILNVSAELIRLLLPAVAYYHHTGPWRIMWVRYGYDPRTDPESRKYQTFDFRLRTTGGIKYLTSTKKYKVEQRIDFKNPLTSSKKIPLDETFYVYKPNIIPPARQMFYQYCDLHLPKIQAMFARLPTVSPNVKCDPKNGWLPQNFSEQCREIMCQHIINLIQKQFSTAQIRQMKNEPSTSTSDNANVEEDSLQNVLDSLEISDTDEDEEYSEDDESVEYNSSDEEKHKKDYSLSDKEETGTDNNLDSDGGEIDNEIIEEINELVNR